MMKTFKEFINEGAMDYLKPKSEEEIRKELDDKDILEQIIYIKKYKLPNKFLPNKINKLRNNIINEISKAAYQYFYPQIFSYSKMESLLDIQHGLEFEVKRLRGEYLEANIWHYTNDEKSRIIGKRNIAYGSLDLYNLANILIIIRKDIKIKNA